jgi:flagellar protein FlaG
MDIKVSEIQSTAVDPRVMPELTKKQSQVILPVQQSGKSSSGNKTAKDTEETAAKVQDYLQMLNISLNFKVGDKGGTVVQVVNKDTGEVIRQIPSESLVKARQKLEELRGLLFEGQACRNGTLNV